ncbi:MAG: excinuclease ABC subunit UvrB, partial [Candidatus Gracilibacteria bacterium]
HNMALGLAVGDKIDQSRLLHRLVELQYSRNDLELHRGTYRSHGETLDIFPAESDDTAIRLEVFDEIIENISYFDPLTGKTLRKVSSIKIFPKTHYVTNRQVVLDAIDKIKIELHERLDVLYKENKLVEAQRLKQRTEYDLEMLLELGYCTGIENYTRYLNARESGTETETLLDYFPDDFLLVIDESHMTIPQIGGMHNGNFSRKQTLINYGFRLPSAHDNRPLKFDEFEKHMKQAIYISATPSEFEMKRSGKNITEQIVRPTGLIDPKVEIRPTKGQILDLIAEIKNRIKNKERTLITTLTKRSAEDLTDYLVDAGLKVKYLHSDIVTMERVEILRDLRLGKFDVLVGINLLREGLDLPEVSLIAILDADKEGFLRSIPALIQTIGRCARNVNGTVIMYADKITRSMKGAIDETDRRRAIQVAYNTKHGITPQTIVKAVRELQTPNSDKGKKHIDTKKIPREEMGRFVRSLEDQMELAVQNLEFEKAAELRDEIDEIKGKFNL